MPLVLTRRSDQPIVLTTPEGHRIVVEAKPAPEKNLDAVQYKITAPREVLIERER
jgi:hypothetical protein